MVLVKYRDRLGNTLFQYCLGRIIAEELDFALEAEPIEGFPNTASSVRGKSFDSPVQRLEDHRIDLASVLNDRSERRIELDGWFQRCEYYSPYKAKIREWLKLDPAYNTPCSDADLVVNVRRTDYISLGWALPFSYYEKAIDSLLPKNGRLSIVTDDPSDPFFRRFKRWRPTFFNAPPLNQFSYMTNAPRLVMSASSFSWWPAFLGNSEQAVWPQATFGVWAPGQVGHDIDLADESAFTCVHCPQPYKPSWIEKIHQTAEKVQRRSAPLLKVFKNRV